MEITYSRVSVSLFADGVSSIQDFWYSDIYIPEVNRFSQKEAEDLILGEKILWAGFGGEPHEFIVTKQSLIEPFKKVIFQAETGTSI
jgi:hypothetical protein